MHDKEIKPDLKNANVAGKILARVLLNRLLSLTEETLPETQVKQVRSFRQTDRQRDIHNCLFIQLYKCI